MRSLPLTTADAKLSKIIGCPECRPNTMRFYLSRWMVTVARGPWLWPP